jgi:hypothetical protein
MRESSQRGALPISDPIVDQDAGQRRIVRIGRIACFRRAIGRVRKRAFQLLEKLLQQLRRRIAA